MTIPSTNGFTNGHLNGHLSKATATITNEHSGDRASIHSNSNHVSQFETRSTTSSTFTHTFTSDQQVNIMRRTVISTKEKIISDFSHVDKEYIDSMTVESILRFVRDERLTYMPQQGSRWDKVLQWAEFFSLQISGYEKAVSPFVPDSKGAAQLIWASCQVLLEVSIPINVSYY
jgi:hypothetical protein